MSKGLNKVILIGNLGQDPEIKYSTNGTAIANLSIATQSSVKDSNNEWQDVSEWHRLTAFDKLAEVCKDYLYKGSKVFVEGRLKTEKWDKDGQTHYTTKIIISNLIMLDSKEQGAKQAPAQNNQPSSDDDLPF